MNAIKLIPRLWILISLLFTIHICAQNNIIGYQYAFNDGEGLQYVAVTPTVDFNLVTDIDVSSLTNDVNIFHIRFQDDQGQWSGMISKVFVKPPEAFTNASNIVGYEYAFNDGEGLQFVPVTPSADFNLVTDIDVSSFTNDVNIFHIRFQDDLGQWSSMISKVFVKPPEAFTNASTIVGYEYAFNNGEGLQYVAVTPTLDYNLVTDIDVSSFMNDVNIFHIRFQDDLGQWSSMISKVFVKPPETFAAASTIVGYEYAFNDEEGLQYVPVSPTTDYNLVTDIDVTSLTNDINIFHIRFQDDLGQWSSMISKMFIKPPEPPTFPGNTIVAYDYWFDDDMSTKVTVPIDPGEVDLVLVEDLDVTQIWAGEHTVNMQFKDDYGIHSVVSTDTINKAVLPIAEFTPDITEICVGETVSFTNTSIDYDIVNWNFDDGEVSSVENPSHTFNTSGSFNVSLTATDTGSGLDSIATQTIQVYDYPVNTVTLDEGLPATTITADQAGATYQWIDCTNGNIPIDGEVNQVFYPLAYGDYAVEITLNNCTIVSDCVTVSSLDNEEFDLNKLVQFYPNPVDEILNVKTEIPLLINVYSLNGVEVRSYKLNLGVNSIDLGEIPAGLYILKVKELSESINHKHFIYKLIKD